MQLLCLEGLPLPAVAPGLVRPAAAEEADSEREILICMATRSLGYRIELLNLVQFNCTIMVGN
jgi:hypothetical protein